MATVVIKQMMKQPMIIAPALPEIFAAAAFPSPSRFPIRIVVASPVAPAHLRQNECNRKPESVPDFDRDFRTVRTDTERYWKIKESDVGDAGMSRQLDGTQRASAAGSDLPRPPLAYVKQIDQPYQKCYSIKQCRGVNISISRTHCGCHTRHAEFRHVPPPTQRLCSPSTPALLVYARADTVAP